MTNEMTNEEAIAWLEHHFDPLPDGTKQSEAVSLAIKALETIPKYKDAYNKGYEAGVKATNIDCGVVWEERIDAIKADIDKQYKWLMQTKQTLSDIDIAFDAIKSSIDKHCGGDTE